MKLADQICLRLMSFCRSGGYDIVIPNYYVGLWEMDVFKLMPSGFVYEYEIKISRADYFNDFKKAFGSNKKHDRFIDKSCPCNRFYFVVPKDLIKVDEVPEYAGLIYFDSFFTVVKNAPLIHKQKKGGENYYRSIAQSLAFRENVHKGKARYWKRMYDLEVKRQIS